MALVLLEDRDFMPQYVIYANENARKTGTNDREKDNSPNSTHTKPNYMVIIDPNFFWYFFVNVPSPSTPHNKTLGIASEASPINIFPRRGFPCQCDRKRGERHRKRSNIKRCEKQTG